MSRAIDADLLKQEFNIGEHAMIPQPSVIEVIDRQPTVSVKDGELDVHDLESYPVYSAEPGAPDIREGYTIEAGETNVTLEIRNTDEIDYLIKKLEQLKKEWLFEKEAES